MARQIELISPDSIGLFVLSKRLGESLVVTLPDGKWFVVDAFRGSSHSEDPTPVGRFIDHFALPVEDCMFVLLTHFHEDHYSGIKPLLDYLESQSGERPAEGGGPPFATHPAYRTESIADEVSNILAFQARHPAPGDKNRGRKVWRGEVLELCRQDYEEVAPWRTVYSKQYAAGVCRVFAFLPPKSIRDRYLFGKFAKRELKNLTVEALPPVAIKDLLEKQNTILNDMSLGLVIEYGETCVLLTGDGEVEAWNAAAEEAGPELDPHGIGNPLTRTSFLKAPHHASARAWNPTLERIYAGCEWAIATHHHRGGYCLPRADGVEKILDEDVDLAVPDGNLLAEDVPGSWQTSPPGSFRSFVVQENRRATTEQAKLAAGRYGCKARSVSAKDDEVQWVGAMLGADKRVRQWLGGSRATFLRKPQR